MDTVLALLIALVPFATIATVAVIMIRRSLRRRAQERTQGTFRNPFLFTAFGWVVALIGAPFMIGSSLALVTGGRGPDTEAAIASWAMVIVGAVWAFVYGRRRITVWGERVDYQPFFAGKRTIWAMDVVDVREESNQRTNTLYIKGRDGKAASWYRSVFLPRTVSAFRHGAHHNAVEADKRRTPILGMDPFTVDETLEMPDGSAATWHGSRTVQLDILVSSPDEDLLRAMEGELVNTFTSLPDDPRTEALPGSRTVSAGAGGSVEGARIEWHRRAGKSAIDARILATGENGLHDARRAYGWLRNQLVASVTQSHGASGSNRRRIRMRPQDAFVVTYREAWS